MLKRLWMVLSLSWVGFCVWGFNDSGEIHHMTLENWLLMLWPFLLRFVVIFVVYGAPTELRLPLRKKPRAS